MSSSDSFLQFSDGSTPPIPSSGESEAGTLLEEQVKKHDTDIDELKRQAAGLISDLKKANKMSALREKLMFSFITGMALIMFVSFYQITHDYIRSKIEEERRTQDLILQNQEGYPYKRLEIEFE